MEQKSTPTLKADFLDIRYVFAELAKGGRTLAAACALTLYTLSLGASIYYKVACMRAAWSIPDMLLLLCALASCLGLWLLFAQGKRGALKPIAFGLCRVAPIAGAVVGVLGCIFMAAVLVVVLLSNSMVAATLEQGAQAVEGSYYTMLYGVLTQLAGAAEFIIAGVAIAVFAVILLLTLRCILLSHLLKRLCAINEKGEAARVNGGFVCMTSWVIGALLCIAGVPMLLRNPSAGASVILLGVGMFLDGLVLHGALTEDRFLYTYFDKLNRSLKRQADALRKEAEAYAAQPLALPASETIEISIPGEAQPAADTPDVLPMSAPEQAAYEQAASTEDAEAHKDPDASADLAENEQATPCPPNRECTKVTAE